LGLNRPQTAAVEHGDGPLLVLAGAGSGKTRVITRRIARLLARGVPADQICAVTFTNKAAAEMRERVAALVRRRAISEALTIGTFHALGLHMLRAERQALGYPRGFAVYDQADQLGTVRELLRRVHDGDRRYDSKAILTRISLAKNAFIAPDEYAPNEDDDYDVITAEIYPRYQRALRAFAALDFDDLITETVRLLDRDDAVRARWATRFSHVLVDEFQDTNRAQLLLVKHLVARHGNLCVVGDDDQSIYAWRGADTANILGFARLFEGARVIKLEQNYRSSPQILAAANAVIEHNPDRHGKKLWSQRPDGDPLDLSVVERPEDEAAFVCDEITRLREQGTRWSDVAVLYRSNLQPRPLEEALRERQIPYALFGGQQFYERKEVKDVIAYLRIALSARDEISLRRVINYPPRGIGASTLERASAWAQRRNVTLWTALTRVGEVDGVKPGPARAVGEFVSLVRTLQHGLSADGVEAATRKLVADIGLVADIRAASPSGTAAQRRIDNIDGLVRSLANHASARTGRGELMDFLRLLSLDSDDGDGDTDTADRITLTTLHGAKGLEFPIVFLIGMEEELLPHWRTLTPQATDIDDPDFAADVSEERRLTYVGITRAQRKLYLTRCKLRPKHGREVERTPSRFLAEIPDELLVQRDLHAEATAPVDPDELRAFLQGFGQSFGD
jgi:DNA helicase-2/ATP-dependent DNA helicase PcrA